MDELCIFLQDEAPVPMNSPHCSDEEESLPAWQITGPQGLITLQLAEFAVSAINSNIKSTVSTQHSFEEMKEFYASIPVTNDQRRSPQPPSTLATSETTDAQERTISPQFAELAVSTLVVSKKRGRDVECKRPNKRKILSEHNYALKYRTRLTRSLKPSSMQEIRNNQPNVDGVMYKISKLLQDRDIQQQLPKLIEDEKMRSPDDDLNLTIQPGQTIQLVSWTRFHSLYHSEKIRIRFLCLCSEGFIISVMKPTKCVAGDKSCDIQEMKDRLNVPDIVKELLDPNVSSNETGRYAFLLCDGVNYWKLIGCPTFIPSATILPSTSKGEETNSPGPLPFQSAGPSKSRLPSTLLSSELHKAENLSMEERRKSLELRLKKAEEKLKRIDLMKLCPADEQLPEKLPSSSQAADLKIRRNQNGLNRGLIQELAVQ